MSTPELFLAKAAKHRELPKAATGPEDARDFQRCECNFTVLADNRQWGADHLNQTMRTMDTGAANRVASIFNGDATRAVAQ
jgi:hypothetical protein